MIILVATSEAIQLATLQLYYCNTYRIEKRPNLKMLFFLIFSSSIFDQYGFHEKIGTGKFSTVYRAVCKNDEKKEYAIKVINKNILKPEEREFLL